MIHQVFNLCTQHAFFNEGGHFSTMKIIGRKKSWSYRKHILAHGSVINLGDDVGDKYQ